MLPLVTNSSPSTQTSNMFEPGMVLEAQTRAAMLQTRPGNWVTWILIAAALLSMFGGIAGSIAFVLLWFFTRGAVSNAARPTGNYGLPEDEPDLNGDVSDDDNPASPKSIRGRRCRVKIPGTNLC